MSSGDLPLKLWRQNEFSECVLFFTSQLMCMYSWRMHEMHLQCVLITASHLWRLPIWTGMVWRLLQERLSSVRVRISPTHSGNTPRRLCDKFRLFSWENLKGGKKISTKISRTKCTAWDSVHLQKYDDSYPSPSNVTLQWSTASPVPERRLKMKRNSLKIFLCFFNSANIKGSAFN